MYNSADLTRAVESMLSQTPRYPVIIIQGRPGAGKTRLLHDAAANIGQAIYVNYLEDVMGSRDGPILGAFWPHDFTIWLRQQAMTHTILVDEADPLFSTWPKAERKAFWKDVLKLEARYPVVLATRFQEIDPPQTGYGTGFVWKM